MSDAQDQPAGTGTARPSGACYPVWSIVLIAVGLLIIWALLSPRREWD